MEPICLTPKEEFDRSQAYFWTRRWQEGEREAEEDIRASKVEKFENVNDLIDDLENCVRYTINH